MTGWGDLNTDQPSAVPYSAPLKKVESRLSDIPPTAGQLILAACRSAVSLDHGDSRPSLGYRVVDANGLALAYVYGQPPNGVALSDKRLTADEAQKIARLIARLPELVELERDRNRAPSQASRSGASR